MFTKLLAAVLAIFFVSPAFAGVTYDEKSNTVAVTGETNVFQRMELSRVIGERDPYIIYMSGQGGSFMEGMFEGWILRRSNAVVIIPDGQDCVSACAYAAMAANNLAIKGRLLLHRPFFSAAPAMRSPDWFAGKSGEGYLMMTRYLLELDYPLSFALYIVTHSNPCKLVVINDARKLFKLKGDPLYTPNISFDIEDDCEQIRRMQDIVR